MLDLKPVDPRADVDPLRTIPPRLATGTGAWYEQATPSDNVAATSVELVRMVGRERCDASPATPRYRFGQLLGKGGMAEVLHGTLLGAEGFAREVAIKRVLPCFWDQPPFAAMFVEEAGLVSQLVHPNIVQVLDFDRDVDGHHFLVMELVEGRGLDALRDTGPLPPAMINFIITETLRGLGYAHDVPVPKHGVRGVVHRDVSPHNVLLSWQGAVKVSDFGIAKARAATAAAVSTTIKGKAGYMSPEQANGEHLDGRSDLFAVGVILWELFTGLPLFVGTTQEAIAQIFFRPIPRPSELRLGVPRDLEAVTMKLLERDRDARYATAEHAIADLADCQDLPRDGRGDLARLLADRFPCAKAGGPARRATANAPTTRTDWRPRRKRSHTAAAQPLAGAPYVVAGAALIAAVAVSICLTMATADEATHPSAMLDYESASGSEIATQNGALSLFQITIQIGPEVPQIGIDSSPRAHASNPALAGVRNSREPATGAAPTLLRSGSSAARHR